MQSRGLTTMVLCCALATGGCGRSDKGEATASEVVLSAPSVPASVPVPTKIYPALEYKGARLGAKSEIAIEALAEHAPSCRKDVKNGSGSCRVWYGSYAQERVESVTLTFSSGEFQRVVLMAKPESFDKIALTLAERYGPPTNTSSEPMTNAFGAQFVNLYLTWETSDGGRIFGMKYVNDISTSVITLYSASAARAEDDRVKKQKPRSADL